MTTLKLLSAFPLSWTRAIAARQAISQHREMACPDGLWCVTPVRPHNSGPNRRTSDQSAVSLITISPLSKYTDSHDLVVAGTRRDSTWILEGLRAQAPSLNPTAFMSDAVGASDVAVSA